MALCLVQGCDVEATVDNNGEWGDVVDVQVQLLMDDVIPFLMKVSIRWLVEYQASHG